MAIRREHIRQILVCGAQAASADNCQPWSFVVAGDALDVFLTPTGAFYDAASLPSYFSIGGVIENIRIAARQSGYRATVRLLPDGPDSLLAARVSLEPSSTEPHDSLYPFLFARCTNRAPYRRRPPPAAVCLELTALSDPTAGVLLRIDTQRSSISTLASMAMRADWIRFEHERTHREFHEKLRFSRADKERTGDGLSLDTLGLGPLGRPLLRFLRPWSRTSFLNRYGLSKLLALHTFMLMRSSGAVAALAASDRSPSTFLQAGQVFQRFWLTATRHGMSLQPMAALPLYFLRMDHCGGEGFEGRHRRLLSALRGGFDRVLNLDGGELPVMLCRLGYALPPRSRSARRPIPEVTPDSP